MNLVQSLQNVDWVFKNIFKVALNSDRKAMLEMDYQMDFKRDAISPEEAQNKLTYPMVAQAILDLKQAPGWPHFEKAVQRLMASCDLKTLAIQDEADLLRISTRQFYKKGLQDALALVDRQADLLQQIRHDAIQAISE